MSDKTDEFEVIRNWGQRLESLWPLNSNGERIEQQEWADQIGVSSSNLGNYFKGGQSPKLQIVFKIRNWMKGAGYSDNTFLWLMDGGPVPDDISPRPQNSKKKRVNITNQKKIIIVKWEPRTTEESVRMIA